MKFIVMITAALFAMLSVAAADEWPPRKKPRSTTTAAPTPKSPLRDAARPAPAQPGVLGSPAERGDAPLAPPERPASAGANPPAGIASGEQRQAGGGSSGQDVQRPITDQPGATVGGE